MHEPACTSDSLGFPIESMHAQTGMHTDLTKTPYLLARFVVGVRGLRDRCLHHDCGFAWKVERTPIRNRHRGFSEIRIRKFQKLEFESTGARRKHHPRLDGQPENRDQGKIFGKSKISKQNLYPFWA
jgi:hypothetical protein